MVRAKPRRLRSHAFARDELGQRSERSERLRRYFVVRHAEAEVIFDCRDELHHGLRIELGERVEKRTVGGQLTGTCTELQRVGEQQPEIFDDRHCASVSGSPSWAWVVDG